MTFVDYKGYTREAALDSVGKGWAPLIHELFDRLPQISPTIKIIQVKEKWGGLRIYTDVYLERLEKLIQDLETRSFSMCERCGNLGVLRQGGWYMTLCDEHADGREPLDANNLP